MTLKQFLSTPDRIIITDHLANINRIMRRWNRYDRMDFVNCRVMSLSQIAKELVTAYAAVYETDKRYRFITPAMSSMIMQVILKGQELRSVPEASKCIGTAEEILRSLGRIRLNDATSEFETGTDPKLVEMKSILSQYEERLRSKQQMDYPMLIEKAIGCLLAIQGKNNSQKVLLAFLPWITMDIGITEGMELTSKEMTFLEMIEQLSGKNFAWNLNLSTDSEQAYSNDNSKTEYHFFESYGIAGEVRYIADKIREKKMPYGDVLVIYTSDVYENMLRGELEADGITHTFSGGYHAASENYITFMRDLIAFVNDDFSYQTLEKVVRNPLLTIRGARKSYRKILNEGIGWSRKRYEEFFERYEITSEDTPKEGAEQWQIDDAENKKAFVSFLKDILETFDEDSSCDQIFTGIVALSNKYTYPADKCRIALSEQLKAQAKAFSVVGKDESFDSRLTYITDYLNGLYISESESPDAVALYPYGMPIFTDRNNLFVLGLSNENIAGTRAESPVFSDYELRKYATGALDLSCDQNAKKQRHLEQTLDTFEGSDIFIGYSDYDTEKLLDNSRSLLYGNLMRKVSYKEENVEKTGYSLLEGSIRVSGDEFYKAYDTPDIDVPKMAKQSFCPMYLSASSLQTLLGCPQKFYYKKIEGLPDISFSERMPDRWLQPNQKGNLFHKTLEEYVNAALIEDDMRAPDHTLLEEIFEANIKKAVVEQPCPSQHIFEAEKEECFEAILRFAENLHDEINSSEKHKKVIGCEVGFSDIPYKDGTENVIRDDGQVVDLSYDLRFSGSADRVDGYVEDGILKLEIIDYKTGSYEKKKKEIKDGEQIQHYIYAICIKKWAKDNLGILEDRFGQKIKDIAIEFMYYVYPFEDDYNKDDVSHMVQDDDLQLPEYVNQTLQLTVGNLQHGKVNECQKYMDYYAGKKMGEDADHCKYCSYTQICRRKLS